MYDMSLLYAVFRLINFGVFCAIGVLIYRRFLRPALVEQVQEREQYEETLGAQLHTQSVLVKQKKEEFALAQQEGKLLIERMTLWHQARVERYHHMLTLREQRIAQAEARQMHMIERYEQEQLQNAILKPALKETQRSLKEQFSSSDLQQKFMQKAVQALRRQERS